MATPKEIQARWAAREEKQEKSDKPDGFLRVDGRWMAIWLPPGETPESLGLKSFVRDARAFGKRAA